MSNLKVNNYHFLKIHINKDEYWDFYVDRDSFGSGNIYNGSTLYDGCLLSNIDMSNSACSSGNSVIYSDGNYSWENAVAESTTLYNIGFTGVDNGLITYRKDQISNQNFYDIFTKSKYELTSGDTRLVLHAVSGNTLKYEYPLSIEDDSLRLNGGFYQGFYMTKCDEYAVLPNFGSEDGTYNFQFSLKKCDLEPESTKTLNDSHPNNKGIFFYLGTRAENKFIYWYDKDDVNGLEACNEIGVDDFVEDGEIDKNSYIIDSFSDPNPDFTEDDYNDPFKLGDYTDYTYYDNDKYYNPYDKECIITDEELCDYVECVHPYAKLVPIYEEDNIEHETIEDCLCSTDNSENYILRPFFRGCGCGISYRKIKVIDEDEANGQISKNDYIFSNSNEYIDDFEGLDYDTDFIESEVDLVDFDYETYNGLSVSATNQYYFMTDNKFLIFDRTKSGHTVKDWIEGTEIMYYGRKNVYKGNLFLLLNRTPTGYNTTNIDELIDESAMAYDAYADDYNNALAFRITDDGSIGYRFLTVDCSASGNDKTAIEEGYSMSGIIKDCEWQEVNVRMDIQGKYMKFMFYVDGKLVYVTKWMTKLSLRALNDLYDKQEGVPYNISVGGGSQGLCDVVQQNYMIESTRVYPIEEYFAGTFIGYIKNFRIYGCSIDASQIRNNYIFDSKNWSE